MLTPPAVSFPQLTTAQKVLAAAVILLTASSVLGGPLGLVVHGERHVLLLIIVAAAAFEVWKGSGDSRSTPLAFLRAHPLVGLPAVFFAVSALWVFPMGVQSPQGLRYALMDMQSLVLLPAMVLVLLATRNHLDRFKAIARITLFFCAILAAAQAAIWFYLRFHPLPYELIYDIIESFFGTRESVAILEQPSYQGSYLRVVWISSYWLPFAIFLAPLFIRGQAALFAMQTAFGVAVFASYTRGIWLGLIVGVFVLILFTKTPSKASWRPVDFSPWRASLMGLVMAVILVLLVDWIDNKPSLALSRFYIEPSTSEQQTVKIKDESAIERVVQTRRLLKTWAERPVLGHGYGAYMQDHYSHDERPFLYEMVPFALLMKLGLLGFGLYLGFLGLILLRLWRLAHHFGSAGALLAGLIAFLIAVHTNPVFFSFTGMLVFSMMLYFWLALEVRLKQTRPASDA